MEKPKIPKWLAIVPLRERQQILYQQQRWVDHCLSICSMLKDYGQMLLYANAMKDYNEAVKELNWIKSFILE